MKYRKISVVVVDAMQYNGETHDEVQRWLEGLDRHCAGYIRTPRASNKVNVHSNLYPRPKELNQESWLVVDMVGQMDVVTNADFIEQYKPDEEEE